MPRWLPFPHPVSPWPPRFYFQEATMSDPAAMTSLAAPPAAPSTTLQQQQGGIAQQILNAPDPVWAQLKQALGVETREEAAQLVEQDQEAAKKAMQILGGAAQRSVATQGQPKAPATVATGGPRTAAPIADRIYPKGGGGGVTF